MEAPDKPLENEPDHQIKTLLRGLFSTLSASGIEETNGTYILRLPLQHTAVMRAQILLDALKNGGFINEFHKLDAKEIYNKEINIKDKNIDLNIKIGKNTINDMNDIIVTVTPKNLSNISLNDFRRAVEIAKNRNSQNLPANDSEIITKLFSSRASHENTPSEDKFTLPKEVNQISQYLINKTEAIFPNSKPKVIYSQIDPQTGSPSFSLSFEYKKGKDHIYFNNFKKNLGEILPSADIRNFLINQEDDKIGIIISGSLLPLLKQIKRNDPGNMPQISKSSSTQR